MEAIEDTENLGYTKRIRNRFVRILCITMARYEVWGKGISQKAGNVQRFYHEWNMVSCFKRRSR
jgi:hypothetical protein